MTSSYSSQTQEMRMARNSDSTLEQIHQLEEPVILTPDEIAKAAGGAAAVALIGPLLPIIFGGIWGPVIQDMAAVKTV
jgi:hypothetical protein